MKIRTRHILFWPACFTIFLVILQTPSAKAQGDVRWLRVSKLHAYFQDYGTEVETDANYYMGTFSWPADYGLNHYTVRAKGLWIGCKNFNDPVARQVYPYKVIGIGPRGASNDSYFDSKMFIKQFKLIGRYDHPLVYVDQQSATDNGIYDALDEVDPNLIADRMVVVTINTPMGITMTRRIMAFTNQYYDNVFIYDYVFKNTGIIDAGGTMNAQTLEDVVFYFPYRYSLAGEGKPNSGTGGYPNDGWLPQSTRWGLNTLNQVVGTDPLQPDFKYRAHYAYYGPHSQHAVESDWGAPNQNKDGVLAAARYVGCVVLHADKSAQGKSDDLKQPTTTAYIQSDASITQGTTASPYDETSMTQRYQAMTKGHAALSNADEFAASGLTYANEFNRAYPEGNGGNSATQGFGPYTLAPGDSIHIVLAEGVAGISRQKNREVGGNWLSWVNKTGTPALVMPDGSTTADYNRYKDAWVFTSEDSIEQTFQRALNLYNANYNIPRPPPPPEVFNVNSGGDRISLSWANNATSWPNFDGYVIYRSTGNVLSPETIYEKIFECDAANVVHAFDDTTARRGFNYYYYIQTKDDGSTNTVRPGVPLTSSMFLTLTNKPANLLRPAAASLDEIRVVPNPYNIKSRTLQFADPITGFDRDRIAFFGLPGKCTIRIFTERGDLIWEKAHTNGSGDEYWNSQTTFGQVVVSGIYVVHFQTPEGQAIVRKLIVIR